MLRVLFVFSISISLSYSCIPTQNVDSNGSGGGTGPGGPGAVTTTTSTTTTTTTAPTTTTVTEAPFPCNVCQKVYDNTCQGFGIPNLLQWCPTAAEAAIEYSLGLLTAIFPVIPAGSCATVITCPLTTSLRVKIFGAEIPAPVLYAWCRESGPNAGTWYTGATDLLKVEVVSLACRPIVSG